MSSPESRIGSAVFVFGAIVGDVDIYSTVMAAERAMEPWQLRHRLTFVTGHGERLDARIGSHGGIDIALVDRESRPLELKQRLLDELAHVGEQARDTESTAALLQRLAAAIGYSD